MTKQVQLRRGTAEENANFNGAEGEITYDTSMKTLHVHGGNGDVSIMMSLDMYLKMNLIFTEMIMDSVKKMLDLGEIQ